MEMNYELELPLLWGLGLVEITRSQMSFHRNERLSITLGVDLQRPRK